MSNDFFVFHKFTVRQNRCAMKVGTDGILLGAWATGGERILDIGTGTGLIALMMAQRFTSAAVTAIDIDGEACIQAEENVMSSPFANRITVINKALQKFSTGIYDSIVCNPPYYDTSLTNPNVRVTAARHSSALSPAELFAYGGKLLADSGTFSCIVPFDRRAHFETEAARAGLYVSRSCTVLTSCRKPPRRCLLSFSKRQTPNIETSAMTIGSAEHKSLIADFCIPDFKK